MKTLREVAETLCPIRLGEDYDKTIYNMIDEACHNEWIDGGFVVNFGDMDIFDLSDCFGDSYQMWVIGNIHDNADLIK